MKKIQTLYNTWLNKVQQGSICTVTRKYRHRTDNIVENEQILNSCYAISRNLSSLMLTHYHKFLTFNNLEKEAI